MPMEQMLHLKNPQVTFNTVGQYTVALTASNSSDSDTETKNDYITVAELPCDYQTSSVLKVSLLTDDYADECYMEITNSNGNVVWSEEMKTLKVILVQVNFLLQLIQQIH